MIRVKLGAFGLADRVHAINVQGARIARHAARDKVYVAGAIGPLGIRVEPWGKTGVDEAEEYFREQAAGAGRRRRRSLHARDLPRRERDRRRDRAVRSVCDLPIVAQMTTEEDGNSLDGVAARDVRARAGRSAAPTWSASTAASDRRRCSRRSSGWPHVAHVKLSAQPNAGKPRDIEGRNIYLCSPEYMASYARRFINTGVRLVGGCCGTTPEHIRQIKTAVRSLGAGGAARRTARRPRGGAGRASRAAAAGAARAEVAAGATRWRAAAFVVSVELMPPRGLPDRARSIEQARRLKIRGVDLVNIPDGPRASARMSALSLAVLVQQQAGVETILHYACRDRQPARHAVGSARRARDGRCATCCWSPAIRREVGDYPDATAVFDVDSIGLDQRRRAAEPRLRHRRPADRRADRVPHRRGGQSRRARISTKSCGDSSTRSRRAPSSR